VIRLTLYSRPACHLCEVMLEAMQPYLHGRAVVEVVDVDSDIALKKRYGLDIPVLAQGEHEVCRHRLDTEALEVCLSRSEV